MAAGDGGGGGGFTLVVHEQALRAVITELEDAQRDLTTRVDGIRDQVRGRVSKWGDGTQSRSAHDDFDRRFSASVQEMSAALGRLKAALDDVAALAHQTEVDATVIMS
ncbi:hypothetical protein SAMN05421595_0690 [Austwickia chelonae]|uniref:Uncharacterized protein n=1 Tax=Austwickia chelonae NBRC 105200 TaxID=1184607 RepID=K6VN73_9MICO|nr:hypothetical protein [Austwickia chelonae]GAB78169.1 hypothetical protein AUCHE_08_04140 [Austwickia chelonae NBRC 105200]SEV98110.1 hypothetical protein SAMN05421595_0690 [Austwickia chelonae]